MAKTKFNTNQINLGDESASDNNDSRVIYSAIKHKCWLDKLIAYERTATVIDQNDNEITKQLIYYPTLTEDDLNAGFYNI